MGVSVPALPWATVASPEESDIIFYTVPDDEGSDFDATADGPDAVLATLRSINAEYDDDDHLTYRASPSSGISRDAIYDSGDTEFKDLFQSAWTWGKSKKWILGVGGDHSITAPVVTGLSNAYDAEIAMVVFDAHADLGESEERDYGSWLRQVTAGAVDPRNVKLVGTRVWNPAHIEEAKDMGFQTMDVYDGVVIDKPTYVSIDMDVFDPSYAPGVTDPHPFGLEPRDVLRSVKRILSGGNVIGMDIVEVAPSLDPTERTAHLAGWLAVEAMSALRDFE